ncbi:MAG: molecular chaperone DnaK, partial [Thermodesulfobacteriota bacterium]|nr:molecular chaperone DnaK [Thermodesulfobacteriota bacterium]
AGELCEIHDPKKAASFYNAIATIMKAVSNRNIELATKTVDKIMPKAFEIIRKYDSKTGIVQKGVVR